jgi:hypothetical protein
MSNLLKTLTTEELELLAMEQEKFPERVEVINKELDRRAEAEKQEERNAED